MKKYRFYIIIGILLLLYIILAIYKPKEIKWDITLSPEDKNPYGAYILSRQLKTIFPSSRLVTSSLPVYNRLHGSRDSGTAYLIIAPQVNLQPEDVKALFHYISSGNDVFISTYNLGKAFSDTLGLQTGELVRGILNRDSLHINFTNPRLATDSGYYFRKFTLNNYFKKIDTGRMEVLGLLDKDKPDFLRLSMGKGMLYIHAAPLCFSNYFMLFKQNNQYTAAALSYIPASVKTIYRDQYYSVGPEYSGSVMSYFLRHRYLRWAWWLALCTVFLYLFFESKRRQRAIPEMDPMSNTSLDFVKTIGNLYFNTHDNRNIAEKKITYFLQFIRSNLYLPTSHLDENFKESLAGKSRLPGEFIDELVEMISQVGSSAAVSDAVLSQLNEKIDYFYKHVK